MHTFIVYRKQKTEQYLAFGISAIFLEAFCAQTNLFWREMILKTICILKSNTRQENFHIPWSQRFFLIFLRERDQQQAAKRRQRVA